MFLITADKVTGTPTSAVVGLGARATRSGKGIELTVTFVQGPQLLSSSNSTTSRGFSVLLELTRSAQAPT